MGDTVTRKRARNRQHPDDERLEHYDIALTRAIARLIALLPTETPEQITNAFKRHVETHLEVELANVKAHGHRGDDPEYNPDEED